MCYQSVTHFARLTLHPHSTQCKPCPNRTFADVKGLTTCKVCQAGSIFDGALLVSATSEPCASCAAGTYRDHNRSETETDNNCTKCSVGKASVATGAASPSTCVDCPAGTVGRVRGESLCCRHESTATTFATDDDIRMISPTRSRARNVHRLRPRLLLFGGRLFGRMHILPQGQVCQRDGLCDVQGLRGWALRRQVDASQRVDRVQPLRGGALRRSTGGNVSPVRRPLPHRVLQSPGRDSVQALPGGAVR